jgi:hypothetical protein
MTHAENNILLTRVHNSLSPFVIFTQSPPEIKPRSAVCRPASTHGQTSMRASATALLQCGGCTPNDYLMPNRPHVSDAEIRPDIGTICGRLMLSGVETCAYAHC